MLNDALQGLIGIAAGTPTIDLDYTWFFQIGIFVFLWLVLTSWVFKPYLAARRERESMTEGTRGEADEVRQRAEKVLTDYETKLAEARKDASQRRGELVGQGVEKADALLQDARQASGKELGEARQKLGADIKTAEAAVKPKAEELSKVIADKVLAAA